MYRPTDLLMNAPASFRFSVADLNRNKSESVGKIDIAYLLEESCAIWSENKLSRRNLWVYMF